MTPPMLKPGVLHDEIVKLTRALYEAADANIEALYEPIRLFGGTTIRVFFVLHVQDGPISAVEVARVASLPLRSVYRGLEQLVDAGMAEKDGPVFRLAPRYRRVSV